MKYRQPGVFRAISVLIALLMPVSAWAQSGRRPAAGGRPQDQEQVLRLRAEEVLLNVTVTDPYNHQATDLRRDEFIVAEDGKRQDIASFAITSVPVNVVLMLDASGSVINEINSLRDAAMHFVDQLGPEDKVSVIEFHSDVELIQDWTAKADEVRHALSWRFKPGMVMNKQGRYEYGMTSLYDAIYATADTQLSKVEGRKAVIILTDGDDTSSKITYEQALGALIKSGAVVYVISKARAFIADLAKYQGRATRVFGGGVSQQAAVAVARFENAERMMTELCLRTGGQIYSPMKDDDLKSVYGQVARELKNQYIITYVSRNEVRDGRLRHISVFLTRPGYKSRTRDSYYAPGDER